MKYLLYLLVLIFCIDLNSQTKTNWKGTYDEVVEFYEYAGLTKNYFSVKKNNKWGLVDKTGKITIPIIYDYQFYGCSCFLTQCRVIVSEDGKTKMGYINYKTGKIIIPVEYDQAFHTQNCIFKAYNKLEDGNDGAEVLYNHIGNCIKGCENKPNQTQNKSNNKSNISTINTQFSVAKPINKPKNKTTSVSNNSIPKEKVIYITCRGCHGSGKCSNCKGKKYTGCIEHNGRKYIRESCKDNCFNLCKDCALSDEYIDEVEECIKKYCTEEVECDKCGNVDSYYETCTKIYCSEGNCKNCNGTGKVLNE